MFSEIITVGDEILRGDILNGNAKWLARRLTALGVTVRRITSVGDDIEEIKSALREALRRNNSYIFITGGLGPTRDDMTMEAVAKALSRKLVLSEEGLRWVREKYKRAKERGLIEDESMTPSRLKMAMIPEGATPIYNPLGAATSAKLEVGGTKIFVLPGVPAEMVAIFESIEPEIKGVRAYHKRLKVHTRDESGIAHIIDEVYEKYGVKVASYPKIKAGEDFWVELRLSSDDRDMLKSSFMFLKQQLETRGIKVEELAEDKVEDEWEVEVTSSPRSARGSHRKP
ncbi:MAG: ADP-ribose pyrophosphatase domain of DNA damage- and competence-inducible protein CinA [Candidatus Alkanophagales archaeon MCA70_species_1]|nr:ADP-ribose pyrophosphatase domain of DNA damage- and competence-inducible protein CinA [Candidatus Alkanophaga volatiphilum]